jgi:hypothetical protein
MEVALLVVTGLVVLDVLIFVSIVPLLARLDGWRAVAARYSTTAEPEGQRFNWCFAAFRWVDYNGCLTFVVAPEGLYIAVVRIIRIGHPCLLIPWSVLHFVEIHKVWFVHQAVIDVESPPLTRIRIPYKVFAAAKPYLHGLPPEEPLAA